MVYSAISNDASTVSQFTRRKKIIITTGGTSTPTDYQVKLTIAYESEMEASFSDVRFNTKAGAYIDMWQKSHTDSATADIWIELSDAITDPGSDYIWMYYGNASLSDGGVGTDTFLQYMGAVSSTTLGALNITAPYVYEGEGRQTTLDHNILLGTSNTNDVSDDGTFIQTHYSNNLRYIYSGDEGSYTTKSEAPYITTDIYYSFKIINTGSAVTGFIDDNQIGIGDINTNLPNESMGILFLIGKGTGDMKWSFVRKYIANEPTASYGTAQNQRRIPQFIG